MNRVPEKHVDELRNDIELFLMRSKATTKRLKKLRKQIRKLQEGSEDASVPLTEFCRIQTSVPGVYRNIHFSRHYNAVEEDCR